MKTLQLGNRCGSLRPRSTFMIRHGGEESEGRSRQAVEETAQKNSEAPGVKKVSSVSRRREAEERKGVDRRETGRDDQRRLHLLTFPAALGYASYIVIK